MLLGLAVTLVPIAVLGRRARGGDPQARRLVVLAVCAAVLVTASALLRTFANAPDDIRNHRYVWIRAW
ncbi:MAG: hypothetical protein AB7O97_18925 [Planctomycetota bacterium]